jgi:hypothetical protein
LILLNSRFSLYGSVHQHQLKYPSSPARTNNRSFLQKGKWISLVRKIPIRVSPTKNGKGDN